jgi:hypothetical protein
MEVTEEKKNQETTDMLNNPGKGIQKRTDMLLGQQSATMSTLLACCMWLSNIQSSYSSVIS